jgi:hypothetical protein
LSSATEVADPQQLLTRLLKYKTGCMASTKHTFLRTALGAFKAAPLHGYAEQPKLSSHAGWSRTMKDLKVESDAAETKFPFPATPQHITNILQRTAASGDRSMLLAIALAWAFAHRLTSILAIRINNVRLGTLTSEPLTDVSIKFCRGKTIAFTGPYVTHSQLPTWIAVQLHKRTTTRSSMHMFSRKERSTIQRTMSKTLRKEEEQLQVKSIRRGALQTLGRCRVPISTIRLFSLHTSDAAVLAYLDHGLEAYDQHDKATAAATHLWH